MMNSMYRRVTTRALEDLAIVRLARNWPSILVAKLLKRPVATIQTRSARILSGPIESSLLFLFHEIWIRKAYSRNGFDVHEGDTVVDIGANIGVFAIHAAQTARAVTVHAFEPHPGISDQLESNVRRSGLSNVFVHRCAVGAITGSRNFVDTGNWLTCRIDDAASGTPVSCLSLDDAFKNANVARCNLLKLDCEGAEWEILRGASDAALACVARIVGEFHFAPGTPDAAASFRTLLETRGFEVAFTEVSGSDCGIFAARRTS